MRWVRSFASILAALTLTGAASAATADPAASPPTGPVDAQNVSWLAHVDTPTGVAGLAFIAYPGHRDHDVLFADGPFGLRAWSLANPADPRLIGELPAAALALPGDDVSKGFWEGEHLQVDQDRKLVFLSRDPRAFGGTKQTGTSAIQIVDVRDPRRPTLITTHIEPGGHTTECIARCQYLWTGGPSHTGVGNQPPEWHGQPAWVTDVRDPAHPTTFPNPVDLNRNDGVTDYVHATDVDAAGIAWTSGTGGVRGYWTSGWRYDPVARRIRLASPADPVPYAGGKIISPNNANYIFDHNSWHPWRSIGGFAPGELLFVTDEDFGATCADAGRLLVVSLDGSYQGQAWRSTPENPFRLTVIGQWGPAGNPGEQPNTECSAHFFAPMPGVGDGNILVQTYYGQGTRFIDFSDPRHPVQVGYFVPKGSTAATPAFHDGLVYAAQYSHGIDVLRFTPPRSASATDHPK
ncbi:hypothetical protein F0L68_15960 [Solihabitans fulvus]|uniref:LVIVD repeat-containing protein n=1 Tax=Solihabitans fulvus TaxID=1892852 RepID=A0A5B2XE01_9PSEU|nr:hypothetical protein [Solihabitans fulvus]KAA2261573.1 hypothetical protein F0L68_15960 [Solihabitans fulvus]